MAAQEVALITRPRPRPLLAGKAYMEHRNQVAGIIHRNICVKYELNVQGSRWKTPPKVIENKLVPQETSRSKLTKW